MGKQGKSTAWRTRMVLVAAACLALLSWLFHYLWYYDYGLGPPPTVITTVRVCDGSEFCRPPGVWACFTFVNLGQSRARLLETQSLMPLYDVRLLYQDPKDPDHGLKPAAMTGWVSLPFDPDMDSVVELPPGSALTHFIPLSAVFNLSREGKYELSVTYRPRALDLPSGQTLADLRAYEQELQGSASFQLPLTQANNPRLQPGEKAPPSKQPEQGEKPAPQAK